MRHEIPTDIFLKEVIYHIKQEIKDDDDDDEEEENHHENFELNRIKIVNELLDKFNNKTIIFDNQTHEDDEKNIAEELNKIRLQKVSDAENEDVIAVLRAIQITRADLNHNPDYIQESQFIKRIRKITKLNTKELGNGEIQIDIPIEIRVNTDNISKEIFYDEDLEDALNYKYSLQKYETIQDIFTVDKPRYFQHARIYSVTLSSKYEDVLNNKEQLDELYMDLINPILTIITYKNIRKEQLKSQPRFTRFLYFIKNEKF